MLQSERNCWRIEQAKRVAFLIDADAYFKAFRAAVAQARHSIFLLGWDISSRLRLLRDGDDGRPHELCDFLNDVVERNAALEAYVLIWDFAMIYAAERELFPVYRIDWRTHRRLRFRSDARHPLGGSHHQKIVVVDDRLAFVGGIDLTRARWDTPEHCADDSRRVDEDGQGYAPFHDVQVMVEGDAAAALGELARERWRRAGAGEAVAARSGEHELWPSAVKADMEDLPVAITRTEPRYEDRKEVREVERLYLDAIAAARKSIYIENQYLSSESIGKALSKRLAEARGPEIVLVLPRATSGWLEKNTMDVLRARNVKKMLESDQHGRLKVYCPEIPGLKDGCLTVHAKSMIVDDTLVRVGSANLSNRSMGLDTECDLAIEAGGDKKIGGAIAALRNRLLAEHLDVDPQEVAQTLERESSLIRTIETLSHGERTLKEINCSVPDSVDRLVPDGAVIDPERALDAEALADRFVHEDQRKPASHHIYRTVLVLTILLGLAAAWRWTPLSGWLSPEKLVASLGTLQQSAIAPVIAIGAYVLGALIVFPVTLLILATGLLFGPITGFVYALTGAVLSAAATYGIGFALGRDAVRRVAGKRLNRISRALAKRGILTILTIRILPVAPYSIINVVAGATHIKFRDYLLGTVFGMTPGIIMLVVFVDQVWSVIRNPNPTQIVGAVVIVLVIVFTGLLLRRWLRKRGKRANANS